MKSLKINFLKNKQSQICGNQIGIINNFFNYDLNQNDCEIDMQLRNSGKFNELFEDKKEICSPTLRHEIENSKMEKLIKISQLYNFSPIMRIYGCFSPISTIRQESDTSDLSRLELLEKRNIIKFIENHFETKIIISLDMNMVFSNDTYTVEQYNERCKDLINVISQYKDYKNLKIAIDDENNMESVHILDTLLVCYLPVILFDNGLVTYKNVIFDSNAYNITNYIRRFDARFCYLEKKNFEFCKMINCKTQRGFLEFISNYRRDNYFSD